MKIKDDYGDTITVDSRHPQHGGAWITIREKTKGRESVDVALSPKAVRKLRKALKHALDTSA